jgi:CheY-like chemotaxis protein
MKGDEQRALAAGCDGYVTKPIDTRTLASLVAQSLEHGLTRESSS